MSNTTVAEGKIVLFHYTLTNETGDVIDSSEGRDPLPYLHGAGNIVPGLERQMGQREVGDKFRATVEPAEAYGNRQEPGEQAVERGAFPDDAPVQPGMQFVAQTPDGQKIPLWITRVEEDQVFVDHNHPLAGVTLHFDVEIVEVRDPTPEELAEAQGPAAS